MRYKNSLLPADPKNCPREQVINHISVAKTQMNSKDLILYILSKLKHYKSTTWFVVFKIESKTGTNVRSDFEHSHTWMIKRQVIYFI